MLKLNIFGFLDSKQSKTFEDIFFLLLLDILQTYQIIAFDNKTILC